MKYIYLLLAVVLLTGCQKYAVHHVVLRNIELGMHKNDVEKILNGAYIRRSAFVANDGKNVELWQIRISEDYGSYLKGQTGSYVSYPWQNQKVDAMPLYGIMFKDNTVCFWGRIDAKDEDVYFILK